MATADAVLQLLERRGATLATAESVTGGRVAAALTAVPGSSAVFVGGVVAYSNAVKERELGVPAEVLAAHGAVSAQVAVAMAEGVRARLATDLGVGVTGVAGPDGGTEAKPVGLVYVAVSGGGDPVVRRFLWPGDRTENKRDSARVALEMLLERVGAGEGAGAAGEPVELGGPAR